MKIERVLAAKRAEVANSKRCLAEGVLRARESYKEARRGFFDCLSLVGGRTIVAEIKKASPPKGIIRAVFAPIVHAHQFENAGARCLSVATDPTCFRGSLADLEAVRGASTIPILRNDFIIDSYQIVESRAFGADGVLLIAAILDDPALRTLSAAAGDEGLDALIEVHDEKELERALSAGAKFVGINNRNLHTFETTLDTTARLAALVPDGVTLVSESGFRTAADLAGMEAIGVHAFLVGESFMREDDPGAALHRMLKGAVG